MGKQLIIGVDLQEGFLNEETRTNGFVEHVEYFLERQPKERVVLSKFINEPNSNFEKLTFYTDLMPDDPKTELIGRLESFKFEVIEKAAYSAWHSPIIERVEKQGISDIIIFGLDTEACVLKTALDVFDSGLRPIILEDLCYSSSGAHGHKAGINLLKVLLGPDQITTSALF